MYRAISYIFVNLKGCTPPKKGQRRACMARETVTLWNISNQPWTLAIVLGCSYSSGSVNMDYNAFCPFGIELGHKYRIFTFFYSTWLQADVCIMDPKPPILWIVPTFQTQTSQRKMTPENVPNYLPRLIVDCINRGNFPAEISPHSTNLMTGCSIIHWKGQVVP